ncbi:hypothetical protein HCZ23_02515 [Celeribacter sp. HF31]|uniref:hypothetical protein n=1 Tax=Celeribacter sp. HF31 TaxID=2721558 RepID=UPI0014317114|nr:hypothetical protein [Celeribacter sp. HF31]NIY78342.1 hypothetical protein [Celeribacter sp. HF31]
MKMSYRMWNIAFHLSFLWTSTTCMLLSSHPHFVAEFGLNSASLLTSVAVLSAMVIGVRLRRFWASGPMNVLWAAAVTSLLAAGLALTVTHLANVLFYGDRFLSLIYLPLTFASATLLVPMELVSHPIAALVWVTGSIMTAIFARLTCHVQKQAQSQNRPVPHSVQGARRKPRAQE